LCSFSTKGGAGALYDAGKSSNHASFALAQKGLRMHTDPAFQASSPKLFKPDLRAGLFSFRPIFAMCDAKMLSDARGGASRPCYPPFALGAVPS
jgi:hypothetical protein